MSDARIVIDVGNTTVAFAGYVNGELHSPKRELTESFQDVSSIEDLIRTTEDFMNLTNAEIICCCGVPRIKELFVNFETLSNRTVNFLDASKALQLDIDYETRNTLGPDRVANAIAVNSFYSAPTAVFDCGTAINVDVIDQTGAFIGGLISPGLETSLNALLKNAPVLPEIKIQAQRKLIGKNTEECIQIGVVDVTAITIDAIAAKLRDEIVGLQCIITGGHAKVLFELLESDFILDEWLTLKGLASGGPSFLFG